MVLRVYLLFILFCSVLLCSCTTYPMPQVQPPPEKERADLSCAYFYFLWGTHAEYNEQYAEALEAYEKALICDQEASYVKEKIPVLLLKMGEFSTATDWLVQAIEDHPENITYRLLLANLYVQQDEVEKAILLYNEVLEREPDNEGVQLRLALLYSHLEQYETAEEIFRNLLENDVDSYFTHLSYARLLLQMEKYQDAIREFEKALTLNWSKDLAYEIGYLYSTQEMFNDSLRIYTTITDNDPFDERAALSRIQALIDLKQEDQALKELYTTRTYSKNPANIDLIIGKLLLRKKEINKAKEVLTKLTRETEDTEARYLLAQIAYQEKNYATSLAHLAYINTESDEFEEAVYLQTRIHQKQENIDEAINLLEKHTATEAGRSPLFYVLLSSLYQTKGEYLAAMQLMEAGIDIYPENLQLLFEYALVLEKNDLTEQALIVMESVLDVQPDHAEALNYIGYTWADKNIHLEKALEYILRADMLKPDNGFIIDSLGWVYYRLGDFQKAQKELERSLVLIPDDPYIYDHLGDVYRSLNKFTKAREVYQKAYEMFEDEKNKVKIKQKIDALENQ